MTTTGTTAINFNLIDIIEEAWERAGKEMRTGYDMKTARRSLNLLTMEWSNRGINLWTIEQGTIALVSGTATYDLPIDTVDIIEHVVRSGTGTTQQDVNVERISVSTFAHIPTKSQTGARPNQLWVNRLTGATEAGGVTFPTVTVWPVPDNSDHTLVYWRMRRMQDVGSGIETQDIPYRFMPAMIAGLAFHLAVKSPDLYARVPMLKQMYDDAWADAADEDRDRADFRITPRVG